MVQDANQKGLAYSTMTLDERKLLKFKSLKEMMLFLYDKFPNGRLIGHIVKRVILDKDILRDLTEQHYLNKEGSSETYTLGANALPLVVTWKTEELNQKITNLTIMLVILTLLSIGISIFTILLSITQ